MIFSGMTSSNTAEYKFYLKSGVIKFQFIIIIISFIWTHNCAVLMTKYFEETIMRSLYLTNLIR